MGEFNQLDMIYPTDVTEFDNIYGTWKSPELNYNFGLTTTMGELEMRRQQTEDQLSLRSLMKESSMAGEAESALEGSSRGGPMTNRFYKPTSVGGSGAKRGRRKLRMNL